jgi:antitoxin YefM
MTIYTSTQARARLFNLIDEANNSHEPIYVKGKRNDAVIIAKTDYEAMQESLYLHSIPTLVKKLIDASNEPIEECVDHEEAWK